MNELERARMMQIYRNEAQGMGGFQLGGAYCRRKVKTAKGTKCITKSKSTARKPKGFKAPTARLYVKKDGEFVTLDSALKNPTPKKKAKKLKGGFPIGGSFGDSEGDDFLYDYLAEMNGGAKPKKNARKAVSVKTTKKWVTPNTGEDCVSRASYAASSNPWVMFLKLNAKANGDSYSDALMRARDGGLASEYARFKSGAKRLPPIPLPKPKKIVYATEDEYDDYTSQGTEKNNQVAEDFMLSLIPDEEEAAIPIGIGQGRRRRGLRMR